jgi:hypothetical protein
MERINAFRSTGACCILSSALYFCAWFSLTPSPPSPPSLNSLPCSAISNSPDRSRRHFTQPTGPQPADRPTGRATSPLSGGGGPSYAGAPTQVLGGPSRGIRTFERSDHLVYDGTLKPQEGLPSSVTGSGGLSRGPRGQQGARPPPGGAATVSLGQDTLSYSCSTSESQWRPAVSAEEQAVSAGQAVAGGRVPAYELGERRRNGQVVHPTHPVGGASSLRLSDGSAPAVYTEGIKEAQYAAALHPMAREEAAAMDTAGKRVTPKPLGSIVRLTQPVGGRDTGASAIVTGRYIVDSSGSGSGSSGASGTPSQQHNSSSSSSSSSSSTASLASGTSSPLKKSLFSPVPESGADAVGANSSRYLASAQQEAPAPSQQLRSRNDATGVGALLASGGGSSSLGGSVLSPRDRKVTVDGVCKAVGGWVGRGLSGLDEPNAQGAVVRQ